jgi:hypothetical protein
MFKTEVVAKRQKLQLPKFDERFFKSVGSVVQSSIIDNITSGTMVDGGDIKKNSPGTILRKRKLGHMFAGSIKSLIDEQGRFVQPGEGGSWSITTTENSVKIKPRSGWLKETSQKLQEAGYRGWFGLNRRAKQILIKLIREYLSKGLKATR